MTKIDIIRIFLFIVGALLGIVFSGYFMIWYDDRCKRKREEEMNKELKKKRATI